MLSNLVMVVTITICATILNFGYYGNALAADNNPNRFNRLLIKKEQHNPPLKKDGIHDPQNFGIRALQEPKLAFSVLESDKAGNYVDWVKSLQEHKIKPRYDLTDPTAENILFDLNIVREVKGSMPDVVYPHKQHTQWLDCTNCHPDIFIPEKGANQISMVEILLGRKCGVCHGKVAFPVTECKRCHSKPKEEPKSTKN
jgi:c(7)-type cytochrome triheme protein